MCRYSVLLSRRPRSFYGYDWQWTGIGYAAFDRSGTLSITALVDDCELGKAQVEWLFDTTACFIREDDKNGRNQSKYMLICQVKDKRLVLQRIYFP